MNPSTIFQNLLNSVQSIASSGWIGIVAMALAALGVGGGLFFIIKKLNGAIDANDINNANSDAGSTGQSIQNQIDANAGTIAGMKDRDPVVAPPPLPPPSPSPAPAPVVAPPVVPPPPAPAPVQVPDTKPEPVQKPDAPKILTAPLAWDGKNAAAKDWSKAILNLINRSKMPDVPLSDAPVFFPKWASFNRDQRVIALASLFVKTVKYECDYNPKSATVDVGNPNNKDTWSVGLLQMSVVDQKNYGLNFGYSFADLQDGLKNINLAMAIAEKLIVADHAIATRNADGHYRGLARYWGTLRLGKHSRDMIVEYCRTVVPKA